jgi:hypothetical protein
MNEENPRSAGILRRLASLLIRSSDARYILGDLDEIMEREVARGVPRWRALLRYSTNTTASARQGGRPDPPAHLDDAHGRSPGR